MKMDTLICVIKGLGGGVGGGDGDGVGESVDTMVVKRTKGVLGFLGHKSIGSM